jgi:hypothetical protein
MSGWATPLLVTLLALLACGTLGLALGRFVEPADKPPPPDLEQRLREEKEGFEPSFQANRPEARE